jgi:glycosyltransferase involved in cell wall biosynthesis
MISVAMIVKNEESCLENCLKSIQGVDEIIIVDTGSKDKTIEIAKKYTDKIYKFKWEDSFSKARNYALSKCNGDWILSIDADEELDNIDKLKEEVAILKGRIDAVNVKLVSKTGNVENYFPRLFKKDTDIFWIGNAHNYLSVRGQYNSDIVIRYGYSPAHNLDKDRTLRILKKDVEKGGRVREVYYLAREYFYRNDWENAIKWFEEYIKVATWLQEKADAYLYLARCYWAIRQGEKARVNCLMAININANFREALRFMGELSWEHNAKSWRRFANIATNENVLFKR